MYFPYSFWTNPNPQSILLDLYAYYNMEDGNNPGLDISNHGNSLTNNGLAGNQGKINIGFWSSGNLYLEANSPDVFMHTTNKTFSMWVQYLSLDNGSDEPYIFKGDVANDEYKLYRAQATELFTWAIWDETLGSMVSVTHPKHITTGDGSEGAFHLIICWIDLAAKTIYIQIDNGEIVSVSYQTTRTISGTSFRLLADFNKGLTNSALDEVGCWNRLLTPQERTSLWNAGAAKTYPF